MASTTLEEQCILDLTRYELGNALWKVTKLVDKSDKSTALEAMEQVHSLMAMMEVIYPEDLEELTSTMKTAFDTGLNFYDASHLTTAKTRERTLVTEDAQLRRAAKETGVPCLNVNEMDTPPLTRIEPSFTRVPTFR